MEKQRLVQKRPMRVLVVVYFVVSGAAFVGKLYQDSTMA